MKKEMISVISLFLVVQVIFNNSALASNNIEVVEPTKDETISQCYFWEMDTDQDALYITPDQVWARIYA
ncbi:hypothetical protein [Pyrococcus yayanosii]|uniref:hypothetical protein n=1 Tax=Pyrococcus yayanosii TaxID=1008460 RepID=UPI00064F28A5|nr:hypothetical protein [Pyrococcus yayanosii]